MVLVWCDETRKLLKQGFVLAWNHHFRSLSSLTFNILFVVITIRFFSHAWLITRLVTTVTRQVQLTEQELLPSRSTWDHHRFLVVRVAQSLVFCIHSVLWTIVSASFGHCIVCPPIYGFWLPVRYFQTLKTYRRSCYSCSTLCIPQSVKFIRHLYIYPEMISIFPLWTFHLYVATFQQHLHMEYTSLSW